MAGRVQYFKFHHFPDFYNIASREAFIHIRYLIFSLRMSKNLSSRGFNYTLISPNVVMMVMGIKHLRNMPSLVFSD